MMPLIWGLTLTSLRGSILPVTTVVRWMSATATVSSSYSTVFGRDFLKRNTKVPITSTASAVRRIP